MTIFQRSKSDNSTISSGISAVSRTIGVPAAAYADRRISGRFRLPFHVCQSQTGLLYAARRFGDAQTHLLRHPVVGNYEIILAKQMCSIRAQHPVTRHSEIRFLMLYCPKYHAKFSVKKSGCNRTSLHPLDMPRDNSVNKNAVIYAVHTTLDVRNMLLTS